MTVTRCKMKCIGVADAALSDETKILNFTAVYDPDPESENAKFFKYTPAGTLHLQVVNKAVADQFEVGKEYYIDIIAADVNDDRVN